MILFYGKTLSMEAILAVNISYQSVYKYKPDSFLQKLLKKVLLIQNKINIKIWMINIYKKKHAYTYKTKQKKKHKKHAQYVDVCNTIITSDVKLQL